MMSTRREPLSLTSLPNEILLHILETISTSSLLPLTRVSQRWCGLAIYLLEQRFIDAARLSPRTLLLEAFHPSAKLYESPLACSYLGTPGLDDHVYAYGRSGMPLQFTPNHNRGRSDASTLSQVSDVSDGDAPRPWERLHMLWNLQSHFRPHRRSMSPKRQVKHPAGDVPGSRTYQPPVESVSASTNETVTNATASRLSFLELMQQASERAAAAQNGGQQPQTDPDVWHQTGLFPRRNDTAPLISQRVFLEAGENFSQIQAVTTLVTPGPRRGLYHSVDTVSDGVIRLFRDWLKARAGRHELDAQVEYDAAAAAVKIDGSSKGKARAIAETDAERRIRRSKERQAYENHRVLWVNDGEKVGFKLRVHERRWNRRVQDRDTVIFRAADEDLPVCYEIEYEEVLVKTRHLLLVTEHMLQQQGQDTGRAMVMGTVFR